LKRIIRKGLLLEGVLAPTDDLVVVLDTALSDERIVVWVAVIKNKEATQCSWV
jgi:hypothetical protein